MPAASTHEYRVLVVDDCESLRYLKTHYLLEAGYRVSEAGTGTGAIRSIEAERPDLVLLDVNLPDMHGSEVCREVKMRWALPVVYTSSVDIPAELHGTSDGCQVSLEKAELLDTVRKALHDPSHPLPQPNGRATDATGISSKERSSSAEIATQARIFEAGLLREVMDASGASTIVLNGNRQIIFCSRAALTLAGVGTSKAALGLRLGELFHCVNATKSLDGCSAAALCESCQAMAAVLDRPWANIDGWEWRVVHSVSGVEQACDLRVTTSTTEGREEFVVCTLVEFSHEKRRQTIERLFFHDILNLAGGVKGMAALLSDELKDGGNAELAGEVEQCADDLVTEIRNQQQLCLAESSQLNVSHAVVGTLELIRTAAARHREHSSSRERKILVDPHSQDIRLETDPAILSRVLGDMLKYALAATQPGETVIVGCEATQVGIEFCVHDPGVIPLAAQRHIFQNTFSTKERGRELGTYTMKLLTERYLGGTVRFESSGLDGTRFFARYPIAVASAKLPGECGSG